MVLKKRNYRRRYYRRKKKGLTKYFKCRLEYFCIIGFPDNQAGYPIFKTGPQAFAGTSVGNVQTMLVDVPNYNRLAFFFTSHKLYGIGFEWIPNTGINTSTETVPNTIFITYESNSTNGMQLADIMANPYTIQCSGDHITRFFKTGYTEYKTGNTNMLGAIVLASMNASQDQRLGGVLKLKFYISFKNNLF